jgi:hypothetical protein
LATPVRNVRYSFKTTPRKIVFISGIPEPENYNKTNQKHEAKFNYYK